MSKKAEVSAKKLSEKNDKEEELLTDNISEIDDELQQYSAKHLHKNLANAKKNITQKCGSLLLKEVYGTLHTLLVENAKLESNIWTQEYVGCPICAIKQDATTGRFDIDLDDDLKFLSANEFQKKLESNYLMDLDDVSRENPKTFNITYDFTTSMTANVFQVLSNYGYIVKWDVSNKKVYSYIPMTKELLSKGSTEINNDEFQEYSAENLVEQILMAKERLLTNCGSSILKEVFEAFNELLLNGKKINSNIWSCDYIGCMIDSIKQNNDTNVFEVTLGEDFEFLTADEFRKDMEFNTLVDLETVAEKNPKTFKFAYNITSALEIFKFLSSYEYIVKWDSSKKKVYAYITLSDLEEENTETE